MSEEQPPEPTEDELRAAYEAELARLDVTDMIAQALISLMNLGAVRLSPPEGQEPDVEQARDAIDAARALVPLLERRRPQEAQQIKPALAQLQMAFVRAAPASGEAGAPGAPAGEQASGEQPPASQEGPGPAQSSGRLWVPGS
jgi:hypothetical protein